MPEQDNYDDEVISIYDVAVAILILVQKKKAETVDVQSNIICKNFIRHYY